MALGVWFHRKVPHTAVVAQAEAQVFWWLANCFRNFQEAEKYQSRPEQSRLRKLLKRLTDSGINVKSTGLCDARPWKACTRDRSRFAPGTGRPSDIGQAITE